MPTNDFLVFAGDPAANVITQAQYAASGFTQRILGFSTGTAYSNQCNKPWRQATMIASMIAQFSVDNANQDMLDDGSPGGMAALQAHFTAAVRQIAVGSASTGYLPLTGGTLTGPLVINSSANQLTINAPAGSDAIELMSRQAGHNAYHVAQTGTAARWALIYADASPEQGNNTGSNWAINRYADNGGYLDTPITINRASGVVNFARSPTVAGGALPYVPIGGGRMTGLLDSIGIRYDWGGFPHIHRFYWDGNLHAIIDNADVGNIALQSWVNSLVGNYVPVGGGIIYNWFEMSCNATVDGTLFCRSTVFFNNLGDFYNSYDGVTRYRQWAGGWWDGWNGQNGTRYWYTYSGAAMTLDGGANLGLSGSIRAYGGRILSQAGGASVCCHWPNVLAVGMWVGSDGLWLGQVDGNGNPLVGWSRNGTDGVWYVWNGIVSYNWLQVSQWASIASWLSVGGRADVNGARIVCHGGNPSVSMDWPGLGTASVWMGQSPNIGTMGYADGQGNPNNSCAGWGPDQTLYCGRLIQQSGRDMKAGIRESEAFDSLAAVQRIKSRAFNWTSVDLTGKELPAGVTRGEVPYGFIADEVRAQLPDAAPDAEVEGVDLLVLLVHAYRAIGQLAERVEALSAAAA